MKHTAGLIFGLTIVSIMLGVVSVIAQDRSKKPNIVLIMADDLSREDIEPYGSTQVHTPNLARLAQEGVCLDNMFNMVPICAPTRQTLLTGLGPVRNGAYPNHSRIYEGIKTLPVYLQALGYHTALIGKKHYGPDSAFPFDFLGGRDHDNGEGKDVELNKAEAYIKKIGDQPFFLMFTSNQPHSPWNRGDRTAYQPDNIQLRPGLVDTKLTRKQMAHYFAEVTYLDSLVGACLDILERTGKKENTVVMFTTEQGNSFPFSKWTLYDQGLRSGFIVRWPGSVKPNSRNPAMVQYTDILPTLVEIAGGDPTTVHTGSVDGQGGTGFDGASFMKILLGKSTHLRDEVYGVNTTRGIIKGSAAYASRSIRTHRYLYIRNLNYKEQYANVVTASPLFAGWMKEDAVQASRYITRPEEELYDIVNDPYQLKNLANDAGLQQMKQEMWVKLQIFMKQQKDKGVATEMNALDRQVKHGR